MIILPATEAVRPVQRILFSILMPLIITLVGKHANKCQLVQVVLFWLRADLTMKTLLQFFC
jgi:hypothetical protein